GNFRKILDIDRVPRLGQNLKKDGLLNKAAVRSAIEVMKEYSSIAAANNAENIVSVGTMALRNARDSAEFVSSVKEECGLDIEIISGEEEARLSFLTVKYGLQIANESLTVIDVGGGSTEFITGKNGKISYSCSVGTGAVSLKDDHYFSDPVTKAEFNKGRLDISEKIEPVQDLKGKDKFVGIGGTLTNIASIKFGLEEYDPDIVHGSILRRDELTEMINRFRQSTIEEIRRIKGLQPDRADVILAGSCIVDVIMEKTGYDSIIVSDWGLRHGIMYERFGGV
ncbi:Ppx/GppA family phosphatase, partial [candidate division KSB1 bacterium]